MRNRPVFIVEGDMEQDFLAAICPGSIIRRIPANGDDVLLDRIAERTAALIATLPAKAYPIFIVFDREGRAANCEAIEAALLQKMIALGVNDEISIYVADRDTESWILTDADVLIALGLADVSLRSANCESVKCKGRLKFMYRARGHAYSERADGTRLLKSCSAGRIAARSRSFARLRSGIQQSLAAAGLTCAWLNH